MPWIRPGLETAGEAGVGDGLEIAGETGVGDGVVARSGAGS